MANFDEENGDPGVASNSRHEGAFKAPECPRCGGPSSGSCSRHSGMAAAFDNLVIMCGRCHRRSEECAAVVVAQAQMLDIASRQQQFLAVNRSYAATADLTASGYTLPSELSGKYSFTSVPGSGTVPSYVITFTPLAGTSQANDGALTLNSDGVKTPLEKWK